MLILSPSITTSSLAATIHGCSGSSPVGLEGSLVEGRAGLGTTTCGCLGSSLERRTGLALLADRLRRIKAVSTSSGCSSVDRQGAMACAGRTGMRFGSARAIMSLGMCCTALVSSS
jgi:hypothetical protein